MKNFLYKKRKTENKGFTIIEMMVAITVFLIVITIGTTSLMNLYSANRKAQDMRSVLDGLSFAMDDMARNIRTGYNYKCLTSSDSDLVGPPLNCQDGFGIAFECGDSICGPDISGDRWVYFISKGRLMKSTDEGVNLVQMTPDEVVINSNTSGFMVFGSSNSDTQQPLVKMRLVGEIINSKGEKTPFSLQTTVSQRLSDIPND